MRATVLLAVSATVFCQSLLAAPLEEAGIELHQSSVSLGKQIIVEVADDWFQVKVPTQGYCVISKAPDWKTYFYRPDKKICKMMTYGEVSKKSSLAGAIGAMSYTTEFKLPSTHTEVRRRGFVFLQYKLPGTRNEPIFLNEQLKREEVIVEHFTLSTLKTKLPKEGALIISRIFSVPATPGLPYSLIGLRSDHNYNATLATDAVKSVRLKKPDFAAIAKYKRAAKLEQILYAQSPSDMYVDLIH